MRKRSGVAIAVLAAGLSGCADPELRSPDDADTLLLVTTEGLDASHTGSGGHPEARTPHLARCVIRAETGSNAGW